MNWIRNAAAVLGLGLLTAGLGFAWWPAALIVPGTLLFGSAVWAHLRGR